MMIRELGVKPGWWLVELGCGSGVLATSLWSRGMRVTGVDCSHELLSIAREVNGPAGIEWIQTFAENYWPKPNENDAPDVVFSYEAFHLFHDKKRVVGNAASYLRPGGYFAVGWCEYHWEALLRDVIVKVFALSGIEWGEWGYQGCPEFIEVIDSEERFFTNCRTSTISVRERTPVATIAQFLASIGKAAELGSERRLRLKKNLEDAFSKECERMEIEGETRYWLRSTMRRTPHGATRCNCETVD
jgi:SAM-dependent methyltransferase